MSVVTRPRSPRLPREQRREQLLDVVLAMVASEGFGALSMESIARQAKIAKTVVYDNFGDLDGLIEALGQREQDRAWQAIAAAAPSPPLPDDPVVAAVTAITSILGDVAARPDSWRLLLLTPDGAPPSLRAAIERHRARLLEQLSPLVAWLIRHAGLENVEADLMTYTLLAGVENLARLILADPTAYPPQRIVEFVTSVANRLAGRQAAC